MALTLPAALQGAPPSAFAQHDGISRIKTRRAPALTKQTANCDDARMRSKIQTVLAAAIAVSFSAASAAPVRVVSEIAPAAVQPQIAVAPGGAIHVVFGRGSAIYHTQSRDGRAFSPAVKVGALEKLALGMRRGPRISATEKTIAITAISHADGMLHAWTSGDNGATWKSGGPVNSVANSAREGMHAMAGDGRGLVVVTWLDLRTKGAEVWNRVSRDGGLTWRPEIRVYASPDGHVCECCQPTVAIGPRGEIGAMWRNWLGGSRDPWLALSTDGGATFSGAKKLGAETWKLNACPMDGGALAFSPKGDPLAAWRREKSVEAGGIGSSEFPLAQNAAQPVVAFEKSGPVFVWQQDGGLMIQRGPAPATRLTDDGAFPAIGLSADGKAIIVWESRTAPGTIWLDAPM